MYKITETYTDYDGNERTEDFYFNLNKAEVVKLMLTNKEYTLDKVLLKLKEESNLKEIMSIFEQIIYDAYGEKSLDGKRFIKDEDVKKAFVETEAYSNIFMRIVSDANEAAKFITEIIPKDMSDEINKMMKDGQIPKLSENITVVK